MKNLKGKEKLSQANYQRQAYTDGTHKEESFIIALQNKLQIKLYDHVCEEEI